MLLIPGKLSEPDPGLSFAPCTFVQSCLIAEGSFALRQFVA